MFFALSDLLSNVRRGEASKSIMLTLKDVLYPKQNEAHLPARPPVLPAFGEPGSVSCVQPQPTNHPMADPHPAQAGSPQCSPSSAQEPKAAQWGRHQDQQRRLNTRHILCF